MTPLPAALGGRGLVAWRLERTRHLRSWQKAEGAFIAGGRWSSAGRRTLYASLDPATTILEVAVQAGFEVLDTVPHSLLELSIDPSAVQVVQPGDIPDASWLRPGAVSLAQQRFGDALLDRHPVVVVPSVVSRHSWNLLINVTAATDKFALKERRAFVLEPRLALSGA